MSAIPQPAVLIIDPFSSPGYLYHRFKAAGFYIIVCFTNMKLHSLVQPILDHHFFDAVLELTRNWQQDIDKIGEYVHHHNLKIVYAYPGNEHDFDYLEKISQFFCPQFSNNPETSQWRYSKRCMNLKLHENKIPAAKQIEIETLADINSNHLEFPLIIKPAEGGTASIGFAICYSEKDLKGYFDNLAQQKWVYHFIPDKFLLEELLIGQEYIVDIVAWNGIYHLIGIYSTDKEIYGPHKICHYRNFLPATDKIAIELFDYCSAALKSFDVHFGMMHLECIMTEKGPRLIELNPRVSGGLGMINYFAEALTGYDQAAMLIDLIKDDSIAARQPYKSVQKQYGKIFYLQNFGFTYNFINEDLLYQLKSFYKHVIRIPKQHEKTSPKNLFDTVAFIILAHPSQEQVDIDFKQLIQWESTGEFFQTL